MTSYHLTWRTQPANGNAIVNRKASTCSILIQIYFQVTTFDKTRLEGDGYRKIEKACRLSATKSATNYSKECNTGVKVRRF